MSEQNQGTTILVVDDDPVVLSALAMGLASMGFAVERAVSGEEAVYKCRQSPPTIAVLDINMPGISGIEAARQIRETSGVPVMFLTAYNDQALVEQAVAEGGLGYLVKPIRINQLVPAIHAALARAEELGQLQRTQQNLTQALEGDRNINIAMGILMERHSLRKEAAFEALRQRARGQGRKVAELAQEILDAAQLLNEFAERHASGAGGLVKKKRSNDAE